MILPKKELSSDFLDKCAASAVQLHDLHEHSRVILEHLQDAKEAIDMAKSILLDCATTVPSTVTVDTTAVTPENAKQMSK